jgi:hypothetical protein
MTALALGAPPRKFDPKVLYREVVHPVLAGLGYLPRGALTNAEGSTQDERAGIDWIISGRDGTQTTLATRVQRDVDWGTFSMRWRTAPGNLSEFTKRYRSVISGGSYPTYTIQAYVVEATGELLNAYVVRTEDLYRHVVARMTDEEHFVRCSCVAAPRMVQGGAWMMTAAITEVGKAKADVRSTLLAHGVPVRMTHPAPVGMGLGL